MTPLWLVDIKVMPHDCYLLTRSARLGLKAVRPRRLLTVHTQRLKWSQEEVTQSHSWALGDRDSRSGRQHKQERGMKSSLRAGRRRQRLSDTTTHQLSISGEVLGTFF